MMLLTKALRQIVPPLYSQEKVKDPICHVKFFHPCGRWTCYVIEFDGHDRLFCKTITDCCPDGELGYASLLEIESVRGPYGLKIERDLHWTPTPISQCK